LRTWLFWKKEKQYKQSKLQTEYVSKVIGIEQSSIS